jgi:putative ABC transport system substrate-binding protein
MCIPNASSILHKNSYKKISVPASLRSERSDAAAPASAGQLRSPSGEAHRSRPKSPALTRTATRTHSGFLATGELNIASRRQVLNGALRLAAACFATTIWTACAPSKRVARIGILDSGSPGNSAQQVDALIQGLKDAGWQEGDNLHVERRYQDGPEDKLPQLVTELLNTNIDVIITTSTQSSRIAKQLTSTLPIVFTGLQDPVSAGLVDSIARPGGNATGTALLTPQLHGKRLELLKATVPNLTTVAVLGNPTSTGLNLPEIEQAAAPLGLRVQLFQARSIEEFDATFSAIKSSKAEALMVLPDALFANNRKLVLTKVADINMPDSYWLREFALDGGLMAYGGNRADSFRRAAAYVDKILRGAKPADLPVEQPSLFDFAINLRTAQRLGLTVPEPLLTQATELIREAPP